MISFVTVNYKSHKIIDALLKSIQQSRFSHIDVEVIVYDNFSSKKEQDYLGEVCDKYNFVKLILAEDNLGFAIGNNRAAAEAKGENIFFINPDCIVTDSVYEGYQLALLKGYKASVFPMTDENGQHVKYAFKYPFFSCFLGRSSARWYTGANLVINKKVFDNIGGWPQEYFMYSEDTDIHYILRKKKIPVTVLEGFELIHIGNACAGVVWSSVKRERMLYTSMLKFSSKYNKKLDFQLYYWMVTFFLVVKNPALFKLRIQMILKKGA